METSFRLALSDDEDDNVEVEKDAQMQPEPLFENDNDEEDNIEVEKANKDAQPLIENEIRDPRQNSLTGAQIEYENRIEAQRKDKPTENRIGRKETGKGGKNLTIAALRKRKPQRTQRTNIETVTQLNEALFSNITREGYESRHGIGSIEATKERRRAWQLWKNNFIEETKELAKNCKLGETLKCPECNLDQHKGSFT